MGGLLSPPQETDDSGGYGLLADERKKRALEEFSNPEFIKQMSDPTVQQAYRPLNLKALMDNGAIRIVHGGGKVSNDPNDWSLVTMYNDLHPDGSTASWQNKPQSVPDALSKLNSPGPLYNGKFNQIVWSARRLGMRPEDIFMPTNGFAVTGGY